MRSWKTTGLLLVAAALSATTVLTAATDQLVVVINGIRVAPSRVSSVIVDQDIDQPDMAVVTLTLPPKLTVSIGAALDVVGPGTGEDAVVFEGEIAKVESEFGGAPGVTTIRAFDRLHRLTRGKKSRVFENQTDSDIVSAVAAGYDLAAVVSGAAAAEIHPRVVQDDETDLGFLRARAARIGYEVMVEDTKLLVFRPRVDPASVLLACPVRYTPATVELRAFRARLARASQTQKVSVRGWDPKKKEEIVGSAQGPTIDLTGTLGPNPGLIGQVVDVGLEEGLHLPDTVHGVAKSVLATLTLLNLAAEVDVQGTPRLRAGGLATISGRGDKFNGKYFVTGVSHRYSKDGGSRSYDTLARLVREDRGLYFFLPEVNDEVLVAFEHGDAARPYVLGSLWNDPARPDERACDSRP